MKSLFYMIQHCGVMVRLVTISNKNIAYISNIN